MKKFREEAHGAAASPARRPQTTRADATAAPTMATASPAAGSQKLTAEDAMTYLKDVKRIFENDKERYDEFLEAMRDFKSQRIDTNGVIQRVKELFKGHTHLILGFNAFLPKGYEITLPSEEKKPVEFEQAISFVNKIKNRFSGADHVYKSFLDILNMYRSQSKSIQEVYNEVSLLFQNHKDLLDEFTHFLPEASGVSHHHAQSSRPSVPRDDKSFARPVVKSEHADQPRVRLDRDRSVDRPDIEHEKQRRRPDKEKSRQDEKDIREHDKDDKHLGTENREIDSTQQKKKPCRRADDVTERFSRRELNIGVYSISPSPHMDINDFRNLYIQEFTFCEKVKERLSTPEYQEFLQCLHIYSKEIVTRADLKNLVTDVIGKYADLMNGFEEFLTKCENIDGFLANIVKKKHQSRSIKPEDQNLDRESDRNETGKERDNEKERDKDMERFASKDTGQRALFNREKSDFYKPIAELDLSDCERCTPSYRLLPKNYPITSSSHRSKSGASVLNDFWVSVTSGSEDYSFKHMRKNQYEESLFRCEDDRFEMDMLLESVNAATRRVEDLLEKMQDNTLSPDTPIQIEDHLTALNLRCIERLYGDHGLDVMDVLRKKASLALPVILTRLKQKQEEWSRCRSDFNKVWAEVYAKNYHKSLDHRSFYFKQQDMKNLATKALVAEIKEMNEKRREDDLLLAVAAGNMWPMAPNIELEFSDSDIHNDIYDIIKYSCREVCSSVEQVDKLMRIWTTLLDLMLGTSQFHAAEDSEDAMDMIVGNSCGNNSGSNGSPNAVCVMSGNRTRNPANRFGDEIKDSETDSWHDRSGDCQIVEKQDLCAVPLKSHQSRQAFMAHSQQTIAARSSEGFVNVRPSPSAYEDGNAESTRKLKRSDGFAALNNSKTEKEEGELSPKADSEEDNFEGFDGPSEDRATSLTVDESNVRQYTARRGKSAVPKASAIANDPDDNDDGEESTQRSTEDSENACEDGEDPSGSESADAEESSHEENAEDVEQDDHTKPESESEAEEVADEHDTEGGVSVPLPDRSFVTAKPLARHVPSALHDNESNGSHIFYGNDAFYVFFRLHRVLYERMLSAKKNSASSEQKWKNAKDVGSLHLYERFRSALHNFLDGSSDSTKYEDECRATNGTQSYMLFTLDKLVYKIVKQLQGIASDDTCSKLFHLYVYEKSRKPGRFSDLGYYEDAQVILQDENIYRFETSLGLTKLTINLMERCNEKKEAPSFSMEPNFSTYLYNKYLSIPHGKDTDTVFLERNKRKNESYDGSCAPWDDFDRTVMYNGLECKLSSSTSKITYVLNTEDLFYRKKRRRMGDMSSCYRQGAVKVETFNRWLDAMTT